MQFEEKNSTFGRHETFALRYSWLTKGYQALENNPDVFSDVDAATVKLGVGKNMVLSIKYWLQACQIIKTKDHSKHTITKIGKLIFDEKDGFDPYLEDEATIWLIHWLIATNPVNTAFFWFFNEFHKPEFDQDETTSAFCDFVKDNIKRKVSKTTLKHDINVLLRMYGRSTNNSKGVVEEALDSPLVLLQLIYSGSKRGTYRSLLVERKHLPVDIFAFALVSYMNNCGLDQIPIKELIRSGGMTVTLTGIFRMDINSLTAKLEGVANLRPNFCELRETAGINQFHITKQRDEYDLLKAYYRKNIISKVA